MFRLTRGLDGFLPVRGYHPLWPTFPSRSRSYHQATGLVRVRSPLLTESLLFSLPVGTEMFHFPTFPPLTLCVQVRVTGHYSCRVSPFGNPRITARLTAPRGLSQPPTSFFGSWCQGIHRAPLLTWPQRCSRPLCSSQGTGGVSTPGPSRTGELRPFDEEVDPVRGCARKRPVPQDPTACRGAFLAARTTFRAACSSCTSGRAGGRRQLVNVPPLSTIFGTCARGMALDARVSDSSARCSLERR